METFPASLDCLRSMLAHVIDQAAAAGFDSLQVKSIVIAAEEALVNIINYAYLDDESGVVEIACLTFPGEKFHVIISDRGIPYNPLIESGAVLPKIQPERLGGYGIFLLRGLMDEVIYQRKINQNVLTLVKYYGDCAVPFLSAASNSSVS